MKPYGQLTRLGEIRRVRQLALNALTQYDLDVEQMRFVAWWTNAMFRFRSEDRSYAIRVCEPGWRTDTDLRSEALWLDELARNSDIGAPVPLTDRNGEFVVQATADGVPQAHRCMVMTWLSGTMLTRQRLTEPILHATGDLFARLHDQALGYKPPENFTTRRMDRIYARDEEDVLLKEHHRGAFTSHSRDVFERAVGNVKEAFASRYREPSGLRVTHNDLWYENIKTYRGRLYPYDFEDTIWGYPVQDIATSILDLVLDTESDRHHDLRSAFKQGYEA